ncbi:MAG: hypothetical protein AAF224_00625 [Pseudomonadota bacterium]
MSERLKEIWSVFEGKTERRLTGGGVENIALPPRHEADGGAEHFLPSDFTPPSEAAFSALKAEIIAAGDKNTRRGKRDNNESVGAAYRNAQRGVDTASLAGAPVETIEMMRGLNATAARVDRAPLDYGQFLSTSASAKLSGLKKRKKFLGLF